jgi:hypothetical protein
MKPGNDLAVAGLHLCAGESGQPRLLVADVVVHA